MGTTRRNAKHARRPSRKYAGVEFAPEEYAQLVEIARREDRSLAAVLRIAFREYAERRSA